MSILFVTLALAAAEPTTLSQLELNAISAKCHSPRKWLRKKGEAVHMRPSRTAKYEQVDCVLGELRRTIAGPVGFVGNEAYAPEETRR